MQKLDRIAPEIHSMAEAGQLSPSKIDALIRLKEIVKRFSSENRISDSEIQLLQEKYGSKPGMVSWADYFQAETASRYWELSDEDFNRIIDTIRFDLISAHKIFKNKPESFLSQIETEGIYIWSMDRSVWTPEEEEKAHLYVLFGYFTEMKLQNIELDDTDEDWFSGFTEISQSMAV